MNAYSGRRIRQHSGKVKGIKKRERRLRKIGLSLMSFAPNANMNWPAYFATRFLASEEAKTLAAIVDRGEV